MIRSEGRMLKRKCDSAGAGSYQAVAEEAGRRYFRAYPNEQWQISAVKAQDALYMTLVGPMGFKRFPLRPGIDPATDIFEALEWRRLEILLETAGPLEERVGW